MSAVRGVTSYAVAVLIALIVFQAGATSPALVLGAVPIGSPPPTVSPSPESSPPPSARPSPTPNASSSPSPTSDPSEPPIPTASPAGDPGIELVDKRSAYSQTFAQPDGTWHVELFSDPVFYQTDGSTEWQPIVESFGAPSLEGASTSASQSPTKVSLFSADAAGGFLRIDGGGHSVSFGLPSGTPAGKSNVTASVLAGGTYAEFSDFLPGGVGLRVLPHSDGFKSFLVLPSRPATTTFSFSIDPGDLAILQESDGTITFRDAKGNVVGRIPRPYLVDSSELEGRGGGLYSEAVTMSLDGDVHTRVLTLHVDPTFLDKAVYPVYVDPTVTTFPTGATTATDTFAFSGFPTTNYDTYQRPYTPFYHEMWEGHQVDGSYLAEAFIRFDSMRTVLGTTHVDDASLQLYPYVQYQSPSTTWVERISADWNAGTLTWNNQPATSGAYTLGSTSAGTWTDFNVTSYVQDVLNGVDPGYGFMLHANSLGEIGWKRFVSRNEGSGLKPKLVVTVTPFGDPSVYYPTGGGETSTRTLQWTLPAAQGAYDVQLDSDSAFTAPLDYDSGTVTSSISSHMVPNATALVDGHLYYWRVKVKYGTNTTFSGWSTPGSFLYRQGATLGQPAFDTFETLSLGSGDSASVNVVTGNLAISHPIVSLPTVGGAFDLGLTYNSESTVNTGIGPGWRLNTMHRLSELGNGDVVVASADGSAHTFAKISTVGTVTTYTRPSTFFATLRKDTAGAHDWTLTFRDQSVDSFDQLGTEGLLALQADRFGNGMTFSYTAGTNRLLQATDAAGRIVDFAWNTGVSPARLTSITDWAYVSSGTVQSTNTGSRRQYRFFYDGSGNLIGWSNPINTSGSCPTQASNLTCLTYGSNGLIATINKMQTYATLGGSPAAIGTATQTVTTSITYRGGEVAEIRDPEQTAAGETGTTFVRILANQMQVVSTAYAYSTTTYGFVAATDSLGRVQSVWRDASGPDIEQRTVWNGTYPTEQTSITDDYGGPLARTVSYTYTSSSQGPLVSVITEPLTGSTNRTTTYTYNANNDATQVVVASGASSTTTRFCYTTSGCSTSGTELTLNSMIENYVDGTKGGAGGNDQDVTTNYVYDSAGQQTRETRWNYDPSGTLLDSRSNGSTYDVNGNRTSDIANYVDGAVSGSGDDVTPNATTGARTDLTSIYSFDTAGNQISTADPRRAIGLAQSQSLNADDYVSRAEFDALNEATKTTMPRDPADASAPKYLVAAYDELGVLRQSTDFGGVVTATRYDRNRQSTFTYEDTDGGGSTAAQTTGSSVYNIAGQLEASYDRIQMADSAHGSTFFLYNTLGLVTTRYDALYSSPDVHTWTDFNYDELGRQNAQVIPVDFPVGKQTTLTTYDLGGRVTQVDDGFACSSSTYDYRNLPVNETSGLTSGGPCTGSGDRTVTNTYDGLGRLTRTEVSAGTGTGDRTFDVTLDSTGRLLTSAVKTSGVTSTTTYTLNALDQIMAEAPADGSTSKTNYDAAGNVTDRCYWTPALSVGACYEVGHSGWTNPPSQATTSGYDARNNLIVFTDGSAGTTTYDPDHNYAIKAFYLPTGSGREHQTLYTYDARHRVSTITNQLCVISSGHSCSSTTATGSDTYSYDDNDNRTRVNESNGSTTSDQRYCYDQLNQLQYRNTGTACSSGSNNESYVYDTAGNRTQMVLGGTTTTFAYDLDNGSRLCKVGATTCTGPNVLYDAAGRISSYNGWVYLYDSAGRLVDACKSTSCTGSIDKIHFVYDGQGHRTQIKEYTAGTLTKTRDFLYQGDAILQESTNGSISREYVVDHHGAIVKFCDPNCSSPTTTYVVTWNGHGDAIGAWKIDPSTGALTLVNSYVYSSWGAPSTTVASGFSDLGFRFLYVGRQDVQWDNFSNIAIYYMHARHYSPVIGRFLQPDPKRLEHNQYSYSFDNPTTGVDSTGTMTDKPGGSKCTGFPGCLVAAKTVTITNSEAQAHFIGRVIATAAIAAAVGIPSAGAGFVVAVTLALGDHFGAIPVPFWDVNEGDKFRVELYKSNTGATIEIDHKRGGVLLEALVIFQPVCSAMDGIAGKILIGAAGWFLAYKALCQQVQMAWYKPGLGWTRL